LDAGAEIFSMATLLLAETVQGGAAARRIIARHAESLFSPRILFILTLCVAMSFARPVVAQEGGGGGGGGFIASVHDPQATADFVKVARGRSIIVETVESVERVDVTKEIVRVDPVSSKRILITGIEFGVTQVIVWAESGGRYAIEVTVELDLELLNSTIREIDPLSKAQAKSLQGNILLVGTVSSAESAEWIMEIAQRFLPGGTRTSVINHLRVAGEQQVLLKCVVAEVSRSASRQLGISAFLAGENFRDGFAISNIGAVEPINIGPAPGFDVRQNVPFLTGTIGGGGNSTFSLGFPRAQMQLFINAMNDNQLLRILAQPTLVAVSGETASFLAGGEFPVPIPQGGSAAGAITIEFKEFGVNLNFTPFVLANQRIRLRVRPEVSTRDETGGLVTASGFVPAISTRRAETTVELEAGSTIAIAGLLQDSIRANVARVPGIGNVPIIGSLFRDVAYTRDRNELVILVTPELASSLDPNDVPPYPGAELLDPTDLELYLHGQIEGAPPVPEGEMLGASGDEGGLDDGMDGGMDGDGMDEGDSGMGRHGDGSTTLRRSRYRSEPDRLTMHGPWGHVALDEKASPASTKDE
jgi:pilus assembly protein CpaC